ncbi:MAG: 3'-5' exonuclease [Bacteroidales bacterium]|nr:3'-5' exonuclease [Bacteroidales bacterium]
MKFYSVDVETANPDQSSICQIGIGLFENGELVDTWKSYIDPEGYFHWRFIDIHGITPKMVRGTPTFPKVYLILRQMFENNIVVHHSPFDRVAFRNVFDKYGLEPFEVNWLDSVQVARKTWDEVDGGYNLANLASYLGIQFQHHDALEDSITCGKILVKAILKIQNGYVVPKFHIKTIFYLPARKNFL